MDLICEVETNYFHFICGVPKGSPDGQVWALIT